MKKTILLKRCIIALFALLCSASAVKAQLSAGAIAFTGYNSNSGPTTEFAFVALQDIPANTVIYFTDFGWNNSAVPAALGSGGTDGTVTWTAPNATVTKLTEVYIKVNNTTPYAVNTVSLGTAVSAGSFLLSGSGDQVLAYQGTSASPTFIAAIQMNSETAINGTSAVSNPTTWDDIQTTGWTYSANRSHIPPGLTNGVNAICVVTGTGPYTEWDDARYNCTGSNTSSSASQLAGYINDRTNWNTANSSAYSLTTPCSYALSTPLTASVTAHTDLTCNGVCTGTATVTASGGVAPYTYSWTGGAGSAATASNLCATLYTCTVTDHVGATTTASVTPTQPSAISASTAPTDVACFGGNTGQATVTASGGTGTLSYNWTPGTPAGDGTTHITGLTAGTWTVTITDGNLCSVSKTAVVGQPSAAVSGSTTTTPALCYGGSTGSIDLTPAGGTPGYTYDWGGGVTSQDRAGIPAGTYSVTIKDSKNCTATVSGISVGQPGSPVSGSATTISVSCFGGNTGSIDLTPAGGTSGYTYDWGGGVTSQDRSGLSAGTYSVTIKDANNCTATVSGIAVGQPSAPVSGTTVVTDASCNGAANGIITLTPTGGTPGYTYNWGGGITSQNRSGLSAGTYSVTITDSKLCTGSVTGIVVGQPAALTAAISGTTGICSGSTATLTLTVAGSGTLSGTLSDGTAFSGIAPTITVGVSPTGTTTYTISSMGNGTCMATAGNLTGSATVTVTTPGTWLGGSSTAWSNTANWSCATLPTNTTNVTIPSGTTFSPLIDITNAAVNNLTVAVGATLAFTGTNNVINVTGSITGAGTFNASAGKVVFVGSTQTIPALTYKNLQMNGAGTKTPGGNITITGTLTLTNGYIMLGSNNITIANTGNVSGGNPNSFVVTNGTGGLTQQNIGNSGRAGTVVFAVGASTSSYTPLAINNGTGTADAFTARVIDHAYSAYNTSDVPTGTVQGGYAVDKTWFITEGTVGGSNATVTVQWNGNNELGGFDNTNCYLAHYYGGGWHNGATDVASGFDPYTMSMSGITSFSPFGVGSSGSVLPLQLTSFTGRQQQDGVALNWTTANESGMTGFGVERSADGISYAALSTVAARNTQNAAPYTYLDKTAPIAASALYYKLNLMETNGHNSYSNIVIVHNQRNGGSVMISPVPATHTITITNNDASLTGHQLAIYDMQGRQVYSFTMAAAQTIDISQWAAGIYQLRLPAGEVVRLVKD